MDDDKPKKKLFRKKALHYATTATQIDESIKIVTPKFWVMIAIVALVFTAAIVWGFLGRIPIRVEGEGILIAEKGALYNAVAPEGGTRLISILVRPGDHVEKGTVIALLETPNLKEELKTAKTYLKKIETEYDILSQRAKKEIAHQKTLIQEQNKVLMRIQVSQTQNLKETKELLKLKQRALKKGLMSRLDVAATLRDYHQTIKELERVNESLTQNKIKVAEFISQWQERLRVLKLKFSEQEHQVNTLTAKLNVSKKVLSPISGVVTSVPVSIGEKLDGGEIVATISSEAKSLDAIIYIPAKDGKRVKPNMRVLVSPTTIKKEEFGSIKGTVLSVSSFPSTEKGMLSTLQNETLVKRFSEKGAPIALRAKLIKNPKNYSGYEWTSSKGPEQTVSAGTLVTAVITVKEQRPVTLIIPTLKKITGLVN